MNTSYSAISEWRLCQQRYWYTYIEGLEPIIADPAPTLGRLLHRYLERYYLLLASETPLAAHSEALQLTADEFEPQLANLVAAATTAGQDEVATALSQVAGKAWRIIERYHRTRGASDASDHDVLLAEKRLVFPLTSSVTNVSVVDLVTQKRSDGSNWLWEHKTTGSIPRQARRLKDLQVTVLAAMLEEAEGIHVDGVIWNYLRTQEPTVPRLLQDGTLTKRPDLNSTWETYLVEIARNKLDPNDYRDVEERFSGKEERDFFSRIELPLVQSEQILLRDFIATARQLETITTLGGVYIPVRNIGTHCDWCPYSKLCEAAITGGDSEELQAKLFRQRARREQEAVKEDARAG